MRTYKPDSTDATDAHATEAIKTFQPHYKEALTEADGRAIARNLGEVLGLLAEWRNEAAAKTGAPALAPIARPSPAKAPPALPTRRKRTRRFPPDPL